MGGVAIKGMLRRDEYEGDGEPSEKSSTGAKGCWGRLPDPWRGGKPVCMLRGDVRGSVMLRNGEAERIEEGRLLSSFIL